MGHRSRPPCPLPCRAQTSLALGPPHSGVRTSPLFAALFAARFLSTRERNRASLGTPGQCTPPKNHRTFSEQRTSEQTGRPAMDFKQSLAYAAKHDPAAASRGHHPERVHRPGVRAADDRRHSAPADLRHDPRRRFHRRSPRRRGVLRLLPRGAVRTRRAARPPGALLRDRRPGSSRRVAASCCCGGRPAAPRAPWRRCSSAASRTGARTDDGAVYALQGCPMHEEPLHLVPDALRAQAREHTRTVDRGQDVPRLQLAAGARVRRRLSQLPDRADLLLGGDARSASGRSSPATPSR